MKIRRVVLTGVMAGVFGIAAVAAPDAEEVVPAVADESGTAASPLADDEPNAKTLDEVVVEAKRAVRVEDGLNYIPTPKEKRSATSAEYLLGLMPISSLKFDWTTGSATHINGQSIAYYINGREATQWEIHMIPVRDIRSVEVLENPSDPKYKDAPNVINYIVREYEYGAYVRADAQQCFTMDFANYSLSGRYTRGKWSVTAYGDFNYWIHSLRSKSYTLFDMSEGGKSDIVRRDESSDQRYRENRGSGIVRAAYSKGGLYLLNEVAFQMNKTPYNSTTSIKRYDNEPDMNAVSEYSGQGSSLAYTGNLEYAFDRSSNWMTLIWRYEYGDSKSDSEYSLYDAAAPLTILSDNKDTRHYGYLDGRFFHSFNKAHVLGAGIFVTETYNKTRYGGTSAYSQNTSKTDVALRAQYRYKPSDNTRHMLSGYVSESYLTSPTQGSTSYVGTLISYSLNTFVGVGHALNVYANYWRNGATAATFNSARIISNEIQGSSGNPDLKVSDNLSATVSYTWYGNNRFSASGSVSYSGAFNDIIGIHRPYDGIMYSSSVNSGDYNNVSVNLNVGIDIIPGTIKVSPYVSYVHDWHSGLLHVDRGHMRASLPVTYISDFGLVATVSGGYSSPSEYNNGYIKRRMQPWSLSANVSYTYRDLTMSLLVMNPWYKNEVQCITYSEPYYHSVTESTYLRHGRTISLSLSYTFNAGKRIEQEHLEYKGYGSSGLL